MEFQEVDVASRLVVALTWFWRMHSHYAEAYQWHMKVLKHDKPISRALLVKFFNHLGWFAQLRGTFEEARVWYQWGLKGATELGDRLGQASALKGLGHAAWPQTGDELLAEMNRSFPTLHRQGDYQEAIRYYRDALALYRDLGARLGEANVLLALGRVADTEEEARRWCLDALAIYWKVGDRLGQANALHSLGRVADSQRDYEEAFRCYRDALALYRDLGARLGQATILERLGRISEPPDYPDYEEARRCYHEALALYRELGLRFGQAGVMLQLCRIAAKLEDAEEARRYYAEGTVMYAHLRGSQACMNPQNGEDWATWLQIYEEINETDG